MTGEPLHIMAVDGADDDGGTLYVLLDDFRPVLSCAWPQPLEAHAATLGRPVEYRQRVWTGLEYGPDDYDDERELLDDLMAQLPGGEG